MPKFVTSQNIEIDLELASLGERILAFLIDMFVIFVFIVLCFWIISTGFDRPEFYFIPWVLVMFYSLLFESLFQGQSIGKKAMNIKVVKADGSPAGIVNYILRWVLRLIDIYFMSGGVAVITIIATQNGQRLGDLAAGTVVIRLQKQVSNADLVAKVDENHQVTFPTARVLNDSQIEVIRNALNLRKEGLNDQAVMLVSQKIKNLLSIETPMPDVKFLYTVIADYEYMAAKEM
jgi:uncharacterized RDD family membrane protein YckC